MGNVTLTPNIGLQVPAYGQANWQIPTNYDWNLLDLIFGGEITVPGISVTNLTAVNFTLPSVIAAIAAAFKAEIPAGAVPGTVYICSQIPVVVFAVYRNGLYQDPTTAWTISGNQITLATATIAGDKINVVYLY